MYFKHINKTAVRSQHMIADALLSLMKRKQFQQITVTEICEEAAIGRKTFYRNFELKEDVIDFMLDKLCAEFEEKIIGKTPAEQLYIYFSFSQSHVDFFKTMYKSGLLPVAQNKFAKYLPYTMPIWSDDSVEQEYHSRFVIAGIQAIMQVWVERGFHENIEKVVELARQAQKNQKFLNLPI